MKKTLLPNTEKTLASLALFLFVFSKMSFAQSIIIEPRDCGYACSAKDVILYDPFLASDTNGTRIETCEELGTTFTAYICFYMENTTGTDRYTPMIYADLNVNGQITTLNKCNPNLPAGATAIYCTSITYEIGCGDTVSLDRIWIGWNVSQKTCSDIEAASSCNKLIPSGKCGDYNSIPLYLSMPVETPKVIDEENTLFLCTDGFDNDGNGVLDCDEFACSGFTECTYTETGSANDGGLESNDRLIGKIAKRYYRRSRDNRWNPRFNRSGNEFITKKKEFAKNTSPLPALFELIPDNIEGTVPYLSTPEDLLELTNATEVLSVDYFGEGSRQAAILSSRTIGGVYEHTKAICDRLTGTTLLEVWKLPFEKEREFLMFKQRTRDGFIEYSANFSFYEGEESTWVVESHWNTSGYTPGKAYYNFQVWANSPGHLQKTVTGILQRLRTHDETRSIQILTGEPPAIFVNRAMYRNGKLTLNISNPKGQTSLPVKGIYRETETSEAINFTRTFELSGTPEETLVMHTEGVYTMGVTLNEGNGTPDTIFFADGIWGVDIAPEEGAHQADIFQNYFSKEASHLQLERGIRISGKLFQKFAWYRALKNTFEGTDLSEFQNFNLRAYASQALEIEVVLVDHTRSWDEQLRTTIKTGPEQREYQIDLATLTNNKERLKNIAMVVFIAENHSGQPIPVVLETDRLYFSPESILPEPQAPEYLEPAKIFPNPVTSISALSFSVEAPLDYTLMFYDLQGHVMQQLNGRATAGANQVDISASWLPPGLYLYELRSEHTTIGQGKVFFR
ncbi:T9SS type A sorting domain-containing protein [Ascidiimonas aurantiaca]|uniref:T9SS type A sorting domain-containing protein n=1 Tax=Ascidiimonas aurantiaca TaxID=1685432 RepID=UPI0030EE24E8